jgi:cbb3-type cytochrome oxidase maturation protein
MVNRGARSLVARVAGVGVLAMMVLNGTVFADHVPPVGLDYAGTWAVLIAVGVIVALLVLAALWGYLDGQFHDAERIKYRLIEPDEDWPYGRGTSVERPEQP